ncbi:uncharacterized protein BDZ99DRAFT_474189 [Mytilinidion resinicola]|uniref:SnoaL-like domain-containing protein n=1 Tax=Mytilinidion resinicola TaxID=574789 RepID=A0A6A6YX88_9PEZI|nr:uncharacterized protein BDZ99DRAFT_474189 [Mytilinidion resinicola]KAF2813556.1 hypothetical protein BDZ99DRAFT_474189 [Mytilinidion resinicola]
MSFPLTPTFHLRQTGWSATTRAHPAMKWMEHYTTTIIDARAFTDPSTDPSTFFTPGAVLVTSAGVTVTGAAAKWAALRDIYGPFVANYHEPRELFCVEKEDLSGWEMLGRANLYVKIPREKGAGEQGVRSADGREWDAVVVSAFRFEYVKVDGGIKLARSEIFSDPMPAVGVMLKRGVVRAEVLLK